MEAARPINLTLPLPIEGSAVSVNGWGDGQVWAMAAADLPTLAVERMRTMAAEQPGIVQGKHHRHFPAEPGEAAQIKILSVQVMRMDDIWPMGRAVQ